ESKRKLTVVDSEIELGELGIVFQPLEKRRRENSAFAIERVACQPDQLGFAEAEFSDCIQLLAQPVHTDDVTQPHGRGAIEQREGNVKMREIFPDELEHQKLVEVGIEQRTRDGIEFPVMVMCAPCQVDDHDASTVKEGAAAPEEWSSARELQREGAARPRRTRASVNALEAILESSWRMRSLR